MSGMMRLAHRTAVVTGAASGIGRGIAAALARRRCHLALADLDEAGLWRTAELVAPPGLRVSCHRLADADADAVVAFPEVVRARHPGVDLLVNNADVALGGYPDREVNPRKSSRARSRPVTVPHPRSRMHAPSP
jgi:NAD(P)-dependent dehydrogenase (short-subunit alcohol dehydrogenase family)